MRDRSHRLPLIESVRATPKRGVFPKNRQHQGVGMESADYPKTYSDQSKFSHRDALYTRSLHRIPARIFAGVANSVVTLPLTVMAVDSPVSVPEVAQIVTPTAPLGTVNTKSDHVAVPFTAAFVVPDAALSVADGDAGQTVKTMESVRPGTGVVPLE